MFTNPEEVQDIIDSICDRQWERLFASKEKADTFLARPDEEVITTELTVYRSIRDRLMDGTYL